MTAKLTEEQRHAHQRTADSNWKKNNPEKQKGYKATWRKNRKAKRDEAKLAENVESEYNPEKQKAAANRLLAKAAAIAKAKTNGQGMSGELKVRGM